MNDLDYQFFFGEHFENELSKNLNTMKKSKSLFTALKRMGDTSRNQSTSKVNH